MKNSPRKLILALAASVTLAPALQAAQINLVTVGGNASIKLVTNLLATTVLHSGTIVFNATNSLIFRATGTLNNPGSPYNGQTVQWDWNLTGGAGAILDIALQTPVTLADNTTGIPSRGHRHRAGDDRH